MGIWDRFRQLEQKIEELIDPSLKEVETPAAPQSSARVHAAPPRAEGEQRPLPAAPASAIPALTAPASAPAQPAPAQPAPVAPQKVESPAFGNGIRPAVAIPSAPELPIWEPLELRKQLVREVERALHPRDGILTFPYNRIDIELLVPDEQVRTRYQVELEDQERLEQELHRMLASVRITPRPRFAVWFHYVHPHKARQESLLKRGYLLECSREQETERLPRPELIRAQVVVEHGEAQPSTLVLNKARINLGRLEEVRDPTGKLIRRNDLVFSDQGSINSTVSRLHAHIEFDPSSNEYRLYDDNSAEGTHIFRAGRRISVPQGNRRGVSLRDEDEIFLGQARLKMVWPGKK